MADDTMREDDEIVGATDEDVVDRDDEFEDDEDADGDAEDEDEQA